MTDKKYCDKCGKEIIEYKGFSGSRWTLWGSIANYYNADFCSIECLKKFFEKIEK